MLAITHSDRGTPRVRFTLPVLSIGLALMCGAALGDTEVGGAITEDTVWGPSSPTVPDTVYIVVSNMTVSANVTLTIEPGVEVRFNRTLGITVIGSLEAQGESDGGEILFTSNQDPPARGDWSRVAVTNNGALTCSHCIFEYGGSPGWGMVAVTNARAWLGHCTVRYSASIGIYCWFEGYAVPEGLPYVGYCDIYENYAPEGSLANGQEGFFAQFHQGAVGSPVIEECTFADNGLEGIECGYYHGSSGSPQITACEIRGSGEDGVQTIYQASSGYPVLTRCLITGCRTTWEAGYEYNYEDGASGHPTVIDCQFVDDFLAVWGEYSTEARGDAYFSGCLFSGCERGALLKYDNSGGGVPTVENCAFYGGAWGIDANCADSVVIRDCVIAGCSGNNNSNGINLYLCGGEIDNVTSVGNERSGISCSYVNPTITNSIFAYNGRYGVEGAGVIVPTVSYCDFWLNSFGPMSGEFPGEGNVFVDPEFSGYGAGDFRLTCDSPCIDSGDPDAPPVDGTRMDIGALQFGGVTAAPDPQPYGDVALFGNPGGGYPGWVWFGIPFYPCGSAEPTDVLGFDCSGRLFRWDRYGHNTQVYKPPFLEWDLSVGESYLLYMTEPVPNPSYLGEDPAKPLQCRLGRMGWTWVGMPANVAMAGDDFIALVSVKYPSDETGEVRTAQEDYEATPGNWITWSWAFFDTGTQSPKTFTPYAPFGNTDCYPWLGYRVWVRIGAAQTAGDPDQVTLIWP
jgi:hypothetical protein